MKVLVVDDDSGIRSILRRRIDAESVVCAKSADEAQAVLESDGAPDVVFLDVRMPGRSGIELMRDIRETWPDLPVFFITGSDEGNAALVEECLQAGGQSVIFKKDYRAFIDQINRSVDRIAKAEDNFDRAGEMLTEPRRRWRQ